MNIDIRDIDQELIDIIDSVKNMFGHNSTAKAVRYILIQYKNSLTEIKNLKNELTVFENENSKLLEQQEIFQTYFKLQNEINNRIT